MRPALPQKTSAAAAPLSTTVPIPVRLRLLLGGATSGKNISVEFNGLSLTPPNGGLDHLNTDYTVQGGYLVETHPAFANLNNWRGSDYVLQQLNNDPNVIFKRLGDNAYEQRLVRDQVLALTDQELAAMGKSYDTQMDGQYIGTMTSVYKEGAGKVDALMWQYATADAQAQKAKDIQTIASNWGVSIETTSALYTGRRV
ncbi:hypothetical protein B4900_03155 [Yersinia rohdei]|nr:hypothetical protein B4900_03155 [Yersinia rohdei]